jgi:hypothetical protein
MLWEEYREIYLNFEYSLAQTRLLSLIAGEALKEFPQNIPQKLKKPLAKNLEKIVKALEGALSEVEKGSVKERKKSARLVHINGKEIKSDIITSFFNVTSSFMQMKKGASLKDVDYERLALSQELVMYFAHLDGFMAESLRAICYLHPEVMKSKKTIDWDILIPLNGWEELMDYLIERYSMDFIWESIQKRLEFLKKKLGLIIECPESDVKLLGEAENIRHLVVHNGGRISQEYIDRTGADNLVIGDFITITPKYLAKLYYTSLHLASDIFIAVSKKFFNVEERKSMMGISSRKPIPP